MNPLIPGKFGPRSEYIFQCYEIWHSEQVKFVNHKDDIWNSEIKILGKFGLKIEMCPKFGTQRSNMNIVLEIDDLDPKL